MGCIFSIIELLGRHKERGADGVEAKSESSANDINLTDQSSDLKRTDDIRILMNSKTGNSKCEERPAWKSGPSSLLSFLLPAKRRGIQSVRVDIWEDFEKSSAVCKRTRRKVKTGKRWRRGGSSVSATFSESTPGSIQPAYEQLAGSSNHLQVPPRTRKKRKRSLVRPSLQVASGQESGLANSGVHNSIESPPRTESANKPAGEMGEADSVELFTSIQQLCYEIINKFLLSKSNNGASEGRALCLFMFGCQGSSKGEIAFELLEHSSLSGLLTEALEEGVASEETESIHPIECPVYHHMDVAAIIVANIDARISEYRQLVEQTIRFKRQQLKLDESERGDDGAKSQQGCQEGEGNENEGDEEDDYGQNSSISSDLSTFNPDQATVGGQIPPHPAASKIDDFGLITLTTKQRSILQLKLMKYYNSVTAKWVFDLIQQEVEKLELRARQKWAKAKRREPDRVYLINLVPNQLSLFKSCLYLRQNLSLKKFKYPFWAIKFERRTNIKLLTKERVEKQQVSAMSNGKQSGLVADAQKKGPKIRLPAILLGGSHGNVPPLIAGHKIKPEEGTENDSNSRQTQNLVATLAVELLDSEKLGPKYNEQFAQQFASMNKLIKVRYNQTHDYKYAHRGDSLTNESKPDVEKHQVSEPRSCASVLSAALHDEWLFDASDFNRMDRQVCHSSSTRSMLDLQQAPADGASVHRHRLSLSEPAKMNPPVGINIIREFESNLNVTTDDDEHDGRAGSSCSPKQASVLSSSSMTSMLSVGTSVSLSSRSGPSLESPVSEHHSSGRTPVRATPANGSFPVAVELELYDSTSEAESARPKQPAGHRDQHVRNLSTRHRWRVGSAGSDKEASEVSPGPAASEPTTDAMTPIFYLEPKSQRPSSRSPLAFASSHRQRHAAATSTANQAAQACGYRLVPVRIAYANNQSQVVFEVRRIHPRAFRLKSQLDVARLNKLVAKVRGQLISDCENWLFEAIAKEHHLRLRHPGGSSMPASAGCSPTGSPAALGHPSPHLVPGAAAKEPQQLSFREMLHQQVPALVVHTIRVDLSCIRSDHFQYPANFGQPKPSLAAHGNENSTGQPVAAHRPHQLVPILKSSAGGCNVPTGQIVTGERPASAMPSSWRPDSTNLLSASYLRPLSSRSQGDFRQRRQDRHVQFKLNRAPRATATGAGEWRDQLAALQPQHRRWIEDSVFVSANDEQLCKLLALVAALVSHEQAS